MAYTPLENCEQTEAEEEGALEVVALRRRPPNCDIERLKVVRRQTFRPVLLFWKRASLTFI